MTLLNKHVNAQIIKMSKIVNCHEGRSRHQILFLGGVVAPQIHHFYFVSHLILPDLFSTNINMQVSISYIYIFLHDLGKIQIR